MSSASEELHLSLEATLASVDAANAAIEDFLSSRGASTRALYGMRLVTEELLTNVAKYAYGGGPGPVDLAVGYDGTLARLRIEDEGAPFDPLGRAAPAQPGSLEETAVGGLGLVLVRKTTSALRYERRGGRNVVEADIPA
jgi:anti-sigma regulatory factor (Ser/Thr protein kinase)